MNCNSHCGYPIRPQNSSGAHFCGTPVCGTDTCVSHHQPAPCPPPRPYPALGPMSGLPIGMGYVPMQTWECPYPIDRGYQRGTIFPSLDYPFVMGRCRS